MAAGRGQSRTHASDFGLDRAGENHAERVEQDELGMLPDGRGDRVPRRVGDEVRESSMASPIVAPPPYFRGGVTPAGSCTCATFSVIDTRL